MCCQCVANVLLIANVLLMCGRRPTVVHGVANVLLMCC